MVAIWWLYGCYMVAIWSKTVQIPLTNQMWITGMFEDWSMPVWFHRYFEYILMVTLWYINIWQIGVGRLVSIKTRLFSGSMLIYQRVTLPAPAVTNGPVSDGMSGRTCLPALLSPFGIMVSGLDPMDDHQFPPFKWPQIEGYAPCLDNPNSIIGSYVIPNT